jgi:hypothetical protein
LVSKGLEKELGLDVNSSAKRLTGPLVMLSSDSPLCASPIVDESLEEQEAKELNEVYRRR